MPLGDPLTKAHIVLLREEHTVRPFPLIDALGKSNIYRNVMAWQPSIKLVITEPIQKRDRKEGMLWMMSAWRGGKGARRHVNSCSECLRDIKHAMCLSCYQDHNVSEYSGYTRNLTWLIGAFNVKRQLHNAGLTYWNMPSLTEETCSVTVDETNTVPAPV